MVILPRAYQIQDKKVLGQRCEKKMTVIVTISFRGPYSFG